MPKVVNLAKLIERNRWKVENFVPRIQLDDYEVCRALGPYFLSTTDAIQKLGLDVGRVVITYWEIRAYVLQVSNSLEDGSFHTGHPKPQYLKLPGDIANPTMVQCDFASGFYQEVMKLLGTFHPFPDEPEESLSALLMRHGIDERQAHLFARHREVGSFRTADALGVTPASVEYRVTRVYETLEANGHTNLVKELRR